MCTQMRFCVYVATPLVKVLFYCCTRRKCTKYETCAKLHRFHIFMHFTGLYTFKETKSATVNIFRKKIFSLKIICKSRIKFIFHNKSVHYSWKLHGKMNYLRKTGVFNLVGNYLRPSNNYRQSSFNINAVVLTLMTCKDFRNWQNVYLNFTFSTVFLKNRNIISKI